MFDHITNLYTEGDLNGLRRHLLHSTAWIQHQQTAYGEEQITRIWMTWLANCGLSTCKEQVVISNNEQSLILLSLLPDKGGNEVRLGLWAWHNEQYIKRMLCQVDTALMRSATGLDEAALLAMLPSPDPLIIGDYDQQEHPHHVDVEPGDLAKLGDEVVPVLKGWWMLWQREQLANIRRFYSEDALIQLPGVPGSASQQDLLSFCSDCFMRLNRRFCQPESVICDTHDPGSIAILWNMEGDMPAASGIRRVRMPMINLLQIADGRIQRDTMLADPLALQKCLLV
jgi:hypothetical protein